MATVGVWGLGSMGRPILEVMAGTADAVGYDHDPVRRDADGFAAARLVSSVEELVEAADVVIVALPGAEAERRALLPADRVSPIRRMRRGALLLELTSGDPRLSDDLAGVAHDANLRYAAAPMAGGPSDARARTLGFYVAGAEDAVALAMPWLRQLAAPDAVTVVGTEPAHAQAVKLAVNAVWFGQAVLVPEVLLFAARAGVPPALLQPILDRSAAGSAFTRDYLPRLLDGDYVESFGVDGIIEELQTVVDISRADQSPASSVEHVLDMHQHAREQFGSINGELLVARLLEIQAEMQLRR